jgi:hypothetical protein
MLMLSFNKVEVRSLISVMPMKKYRRSRLSQTRVKEQPASTMARGE